MAIVNPKQVTPYADIPAAQRELAEDLLFNRRPDATARFIAFYEGAKARQADGRRSDGDAVAAERLHWRILHRQPDGCESDVDAVVAEGVREITGVANFTMQPGYRYPNADTSGVAVRVLNQVLLPAMKEVGDKFGGGELILPFVLQSAEAMKRAVSHLERYLEKSEGVTKGRVVLATVYGDVHDIGKNLIKTILVEQRLQRARPGQAGAGQHGRRPGRRAAGRRHRPVRAAGLDVSADAARRCANWIDGG